MEAAMTFETKKLDLLQSVMAIPTEEIVDKVRKYIVRLCAVPKVYDETRMSREELHAIVAEADEAYRSGKCVSIPEDMSIEEFVNSL